MPTVSIAMATYNGARFVRAQLDSFAAQTRPPDELVVRDDASSDDTVDIVRDFTRSATFPVHIAVNERRLGFSRNFEAAISACTGDVIFISDQDDVWLPPKIERMCAMLASNHDLRTVSCDQINTDVDLRHSSVTKFSNLRTLGRPLADSVTGCATALRRSFLALAFPLPDDVPYDLWLNRLADHCGQRGIIAEPLQYWRRHAGTVSHEDVARPDGVAGVEARRWMKRPTNRASMLTKEINLDRAYVGRLELVGSPAALRSISAIGAQMEALARRRSVVQTHPLLRPIAAVILLARGGYRPFAGWRSMGSDILAH